MTLFSKSIIFRDFDLARNQSLKSHVEVTHRRSDNNEDYATIAGTKAQINNYLEESKLIISDRLRTLNSLPKYRIIDTKKEIIQ